MYKTEVFAAGERKQFLEKANYFRLIADGGSTCTVQYYKEGREIVEQASGVSAGFAESFNDNYFDMIAITAAAAVAMTFVTRLGNDVRYDTPPTGNVTLQNGAFSHVAANVTNASTTIKAANAARRYLFVQNNDAAGYIYVRVDGVAATATTGVKLGPGDAWELSARCPVAAVTAIGDIALNSNVVIVEG